MGTDGRGSKEPPYRTVHPYTPRTRTVPVPVPYSTYLSLRMKQVVNWRFEFAQATEKKVRFFLRGFRARLPANFSFGANQHVEGTSIEEASQLDRSV